MPLIQINGHTCHYRVDGPDDAPVLLLSHSLGLSYEMWDPQAADCQRHFRVIRYDLRGHGASSASPGDYTSSSSRWMRLPSPIILARHGSPSAASPSAG